MSKYLGLYLDRVLHAFAAYGMPALIAVVTVIAFSTWQSFFPYSPANDAAMVWPRQ